ncbi:MAG: ATP phosphoribosyltransferase [Elusimicrobia bacterium RIFOXYA2_FULL_39_19]|nr:MAG: ATP phosphoribosyltransferase [Elusimicrobia bacterium RIFOXYA2_FULL_39_19]
MNKLKIGLPKGSLQESTFELFRKAGIKIYADSRSYRPSCDDSELDITLVRAQEIPRYVDEKVFDCGVTGLDWIVETDAKVKEICELLYAKSGFRPVRWVLAVPENSKIKSVKDLKGKRIATELVNVVKKYLKKNKVSADVEFSWGATEVKAPDLCDAIVELTETGSSLRANKLRIVEEVLVSTTRLIANNDSIKDAWKRDKIENLAILLKGALAAESMVGLKMNIQENTLDKILDILPALKRPTISHLTLKGWVALEVILDESEVKVIIPKLKRAGAQGIIEYPLNKVIP